MNDSKATNPEAAEQALTAYDRVRLILGGCRKGASFDGLARAARERGVRRAYLIGESAPEIAEALDREGVPYVEAGDLETAVRAAAADAEPGDVGAALARVRELRPVPRLRGPRRAVPGARGGAVRGAGRAAGHSSSTCSCS